MSNGVYIPNSYKHEITKLLNFSMMTNHQRFKTNNNLHQSYERSLE